MNNLQNPCWVTDRNDLLSVAGNPGSIWDRSTQLFRRTKIASTRDFSGSGWERGGKVKTL